MNNRYNNSDNIIILMLLLLLIFGIVFGLSTDTDLTVKKNSVSLMTVLTHNGVLLLVTVLLTDFLGAILVGFNVLFAGYAIGNAINSIGIFATSGLLLHAPFEFITWIFAIKLGYMWRMYLFNNNNGGLFVIKLKQEMLLLLVTFLIASAIEAFH